MTHTFVELIGGSPELFCLFLQLIWPGKVLLIVESENSLNAECPLHAKLNFYCLLSSLFEHQLCWGALWSRISLLPKVGSRSPQHLALGLSCNQISMTRRWSPTTADRAFLAYAVCVRANGLPGATVEALKFRSRVVSGFEPQQEWKTCSTVLPGQPLSAVPACTSVDLDSLCQTCLVAGQVKGAVYRELPLPLRHPCSVSSLIKT